ncbi:hypothetical protein MT356_00270 [Rathayibacter festucae]|uniref:hypothetical protein n=1 Tax=Rathayibacter TaxID=33886 RepID=UPI000FAF14AB|nr:MULTISPECIES: hypothetical protein [Rathayibacter]MCJ1698136.1 hypothetical protein [Rathayibacter festucae]MCJ1703047.1 hypothetical protein [Rathayibacter sp. VKM Ac-2926]ROQ03412.1 hypothetical protein EDF54_2884 [Rathayibacter sp. PhB93]TDQ10436.1 hypothetical protein EDF17_2672 [Rathayibacter sp. PhB1]
MSNIDPASPPFGDGAANARAADPSYDSTDSTYDAPLTSEPYSSDTTTTDTTSGAHSVGGGTSGSVSDAAGSAKEKAAETAGAAKEQAGAVAGDAKQAAGDVLATGKEEAANVAQEAKVQVKDLLDQSRTQLTEQAHAQKENAAKGARAFSDDLTALANGEGGDDNAASKLVSQAAERVQGVASWLENRDPSELLDDVRSFARRRPGAFILIAAATGLVAGRLVRALTAEAKDEKAATADTSGPEFAAPAAADYSGGATTTTSFDERGDFAPTEPVADPLSTPITPGYDAFPNGTRP